MKLTDLTEQAHLVPRLIQQIRDALEEDLSRFDIEDESDLETWADQSLEANSDYSDIIDSIPNHLQSNYEEAADDIVGDIVRSVQEEIS